jgi:gliding motility-associated-like protein
VQQQVAPGTYDLVVADANDCFFNLEADMVAPLPILVDAPEQIVINYGDTLAIETYIFNIRGDSIIRWLPLDEQLSCHDCLDPVLRAQQTTVYTLRVGDSFNCFEEVRIPVIVERPRRLFIPNAFSPNGEGDNELLFPYGAKEVAQILRFEVYNRWGNLVFQQKNFPANDPSYGWDGTLNGQQLPAAMYVYQIEVLYTDGTVILSSGDIILFR